MVTRLKLRRSVVVITAAVAILLPLIFQNCSEPLDESRDIASVAQGLEFAFEAPSVDHIAYMSCAPVQANANPDAYFSFKAGGYGAGSGLKLNNAFFHDARNLGNSDKVQALQQSAANNGVYASLVVRDIANLQNRYIEDALGTFVGSLTTSSVAVPLVNKSQGGPVREFTLNSGTAKFEDVVNYRQSETNASNIRNYLNLETAMLSVGFGQPGLNVGQAVAPVVGAGDFVYGKGYRMNFILGNGQTAAFTSGSARVMNNVREYDHLTGQSTSNGWSCDPNWRFLIVRRSDRGVANVICETSDAVDPTPANAIETEMLATIRTVLPASTWGVNLQRRCIVAKTDPDLCYGGAPQVNYTGGTCLAGTCPHFLSICKRL